jgi:hypothetical protein
MKFKINETKTFEFEMDTSGCSWNELKGYFRINMDNVEYGFPAEISEGKVTVKIPVFKDILNEAVKSSLYENKEISVSARLDLIANNEAYISPWKGNVDIEIPVSVKLTEGIKKGKVKKEIKVIDPDIKEVVDKTKKTKLMETFNSVIKKEDAAIDEIDKKEKEIEDKETRKIKKSKLSEMLS